MNIIEPRTIDELSAHYKAIRARLWAPMTEPQIAHVPYRPIETTPQSDPSIEGVAARWREIDERLFGGRVSPKAVIDVTAAYFGVCSKVICGRSRKADIKEARYAAIYIIYTLCRQISFYNGGISLIKLSTIQLGRHFSRDHSTVIYELDTSRERMAKDTEYANSLEEIIALLRRNEKRS